MAYYIKPNLSTVARNASGSLSEVNLFRQMMRVFYHYYGATVVVNETHQHYVGFATKDLVTNQPIHNQTREISDVHIITYSPSLKVARETYLQAKVASTSDGLITPNSFQFNGDWYQYDLLSRRPKVMKPLKKKPYDRCIIDPYFLSNAYLPSIGSYGVFYENNHQVDFAYQPANRITTTGTAKVERKLHIDTNLSKYNAPCIPDLQYTFDADEFEYAVTHNLIGSPICSWPIWRYYPNHPIYQHNLHSYGNSAKQIREVIDGVEEFIDFLIRNEDIFLHDIINERALIEKFSRLAEYTTYDRLPNNNIERGDIMKAHGENDLCRGPVSFILINTDKINQHEL